MLENLWAISIDPDESMREYVLLQLKVKAMRDLLFRSRIFNYLAAATPGLKELVTIGKIWELTLDNRKARDARALRPRDRRRAGDRPRGGLPPDAADVREHRPRRADPPAGRDPRRVHPRPQAHRDRGRGAARGDAGERDRDARARPRLGGRGARRPDLLQRALPGAFRRARDGADRGDGRRRHRHRAQRLSLRAHAEPPRPRAARAAGAAARRTARPPSRPCPTCSPRTSGSDGVDALADAIVA